MNPYRGMIATRVLKSLAVGKGSTVEALAYAAGQNWRGTPEVENALKAAVDVVILVPIGFVFGKAALGDRATDRADAASERERKFPDTVPSSAPSNRWSEKSK
jgi:hypothetical protein